MKLPLTGPFATWPLTAALMLCLTCAISTSPINAHQFHTSAAELDWNAGSQRWEVSVRIHAQDLELALGKQFGSKIDIESSIAAEWIESYVESRFQLIPQASVEQQATTDKLLSGEMAKPEDNQIHWVGHEVEGGWMWLYFELSPPNSEQNLVLVSQLLTEVNEDQLNIISIRNAARKRVTQQTSRKQAWIAL